MALGARAADMLRMVLWKAVALAAAGAVIGLAAAQALGRVIQQQLFGVGLLDPLTLGAVVLLLGFSAAAASLVPALRAARLDPAAALRES
jgi:ABC-type antimicrobial peptide transport system permease subunit